MLSGQCGFDRQCFLVAGWPAAFSILSTVIWYEMSILDMWRAARGNVMRKEFDDVLARMNGANESARSAFLNNVDQTVERLREVYRPASPRERKAILKQCRISAEQMWDRGDWPSSLGLGITCLNVESEFVPGEDAVYVREQTDKIIAEAAEFFKR